MLAQERFHKLEELIKRQPMLEVSKLSEVFGVSEMTVRRDLKELARKGIITRVHGGALSPSLKFESRRGKNLAAKRKLAQKLVDTIPLGGSLYLDSSSTVYELCDALSHREGLTVVTNTLETFNRLRHMKGIKAQIIGGQFDERTENLVGPLARRSLESLAFHSAYLSCFSLHAQRGPMEATLEDAEVKEQVCLQSEQVFLAVDHKKLGDSSPAVWRTDPEKTTLVTNLSPDDEDLVAYREMFRKLL